MKKTIYKNRKCPLHKHCWGYKDAVCHECEFGNIILKLYKKIDRLKKKLERAEQIKSGEYAKKLIPLKNYPKGLFIKDNTLCVKTEYGNEAYIVWSGEYFWGGAKTKDEIGNIPILPINDKLVQMIESQYGEIYKALAEGGNG